MRLFETIENEAMDSPTPRNEAKKPLCKRDDNPVVELTTVGARRRVCTYGLPEAFGLQAGSRQKRQVSPRRMPLAISSQRANIWYHTAPHDQWKRVTRPVFFLTASGCVQEQNSYRPMTGLHIL